MSNNTLHLDGVFRRPPTARQLLGEHRWAKIYEEVMPPVRTVTKHVLRKQQAPILAALREAGQPLSRQALAEAMGYKTSGYIERWIGSSDPTKRAQLEETSLCGGSPGSPCPSLLTLGYVREEKLVGDTTETILHLTRDGAAVLHEYEESNG